MVLKHYVGQSSMLDPPQRRALTPPLLLVPGGGEGLVRLTIGWLAAV